MRTRCLATCTMLLLAALAAKPAMTQTPPATPKGNPVWTWSKRCGDKYKLRVTIRLAHQVLYRGALPICRGSRSSEDGRAEFHFAGGHTFQEEYRTISTDSIEGDIWQAGGEPNAIILGISFDSGKGKQILLNTLHIARPDKRTSSEIDKGLFITTYPIANP